MTKKTMIFLMSAVVMFSLFGCGKKDEENPSASEIGTEQNASTDESSAASGESSAAAEDPASSEAGTTVTGTVTDAATSSVTIKTQDGAELAFMTDGAEISMKDGLLIGDVVSLTYTGTIAETDTSAAVVVRMTDGADNSQNPARIPPPVESNISGVIVAAGMSAITIRTEDGKEMSFLTSQCEKDVKDGLQEGAHILITYTGTIKDTDTSGARAVKIVDQP